MRFMITIHCDGDAFANGADYLEVSRLLREVAARLVDSTKIGEPWGRMIVGRGTMSDSNGNTCGSWQWVQEALNSESSGATA